MTSEVDAANLALARIGARAIVTLTDNSVEARACNRLFNVARDMMLTAADWRFATGKAPLVATDTPAANIPFPYSYEYVRPASCVKVRYLTVLTTDQYSPFGSYPTQDPGDDRVPFEEGINTVDGVSTKVIWTVISPAQLVFTFQCPDPSVWDTAFLAAFSLQLASEICVPIKGNGDLAESLARKAREAAQAITPTGQNQTTSGQQFGGSKMINARDGSSCDGSYGFGYGDIWP